jgi:hypothetical protein
MRAAVRYKRSLTEGLNMTSPKLLGMAAAAVLAIAPSSFAQDHAQEQSKPHMHMHKMDMMHATDKEVASAYKSESAHLREKAAAHRKAATMYRSRGSTGKADYLKVAKHCDKLAQFYEDAAREAEGMASELEK